MQAILAFGIGILISTLGGYMYTNQSDTFTTSPNTQNDDAYHIHSDWVYSLHGERVDLNSTEFQTTATQSLHPHVHLHDNDDRIVHIHKEEQLFVDFLESLNITLTDSCLTHFDDSTYCTDTDTEVALYVNERKHPDPTSYVTADDDAILLYVGEPKNPKLTDLLNSISNDACIYTGTCPERGTAPPEACGITCEI